MAEPRTILKASVLSRADVVDILNRRNEKGAANKLAKEYKCGPQRIYKIWEDGGIRWDKNKAPRLPPDHAAEAASAPPGSIRKSASGRFFAKEPPEPVNADADLEDNIAPEDADLESHSEAAGGDMSVEELAHDSDIENSDEETARVGIGSIAAGNDSPETLEEVEASLGKLRLRGKLSPALYRGLSREAKDQYLANAGISPQQKNAPAPRRPHAHGHGDAPDRRPRGERKHAPPPRAAPGGRHGARAPASRPGRGRARVSPPPSPPPSSWGGGEDDEGSESQFETSSYASEAPPEPPAAFSFREALTRPF